MKDCFIGICALLLVTTAVFPVAGLAAEPTLEEFKATLEKDPEDKGALYNAGLFCYLHGDFRQAITYWNQLRVLATEDGKVKAKLVQAYEADGQTAERDRTIAELRELWKSGKQPELSSQKFFIRDQFSANWSEGLHH